MKYWEITSYGIMYLKSVKHKLDTYYLTNTPAHEFHGLTREAHVLRQLEDATIPLPSNVLKAFTVLGHKKPSKVSRLRETLTNLQRRGYVTQIKWQPGCIIQVGG